MSYIRKVITSNEKILSVSRAHAIYLFEGLFWLSLFLVLGFLADHYFYIYVGAKAFDFKIDLGWFHFDEYHTPIPWIFAATGFAIFWPLFLVYVSHEVGLTNERIIHKKGLFAVQIEQTDLRDIDAEDIRHGWFGWLLGYGRIRLDCRFVDDMYLPAVADPYRLVKALHVARMKRHDIDYGQDELEMNLEVINKKKREAMMRARMKRVADNLKLNFAKNS